jgi:hypothetical protein
VSTRAQRRGVRRRIWRSFGTPRDISGKRGMKMSQIAHLAEPPCSPNRRHSSRHSRRLRTKPARREGVCRPRPLGSRAAEGCRERIELAGKQVRSCLRRRSRTLPGALRQVLPDNLGLGPEVWHILSKCHDMRNRTEYEGALDIDDRLVSDLIGACRRGGQDPPTAADSGSVKVITLLLQLALYHVPASTPRRRSHQSHNFSLRT